MMRKAKDDFALETGTRLSITDEEDGTFEGILSKKVIGTNGNFTLILEKCRRVGSNKILPGLQSFKSTAMTDLKVIDDRYRDDEDQEKKIPEEFLISEKGGIAKKHNKGMNPHLEKLYPPQMEEILGQLQIAPPPVLHTLEQQFLTPRLLPVPLQELAHMTGEKYKDKNVEQFRVIRLYVWSDPQTPPSLQWCPQKLYLIDNPAHAEGFEFAFNELTNQTMIGMSIQCHKIGRAAELSLLLCSTKTDVFLFDMVKLGSDRVLNNSPLRDLLEDGGVMKVVHDSRAVSDLLKHQYDIVLSNVYDTLAAHLVFSCWSTYHGHLPRYTFPLNELVRGYLGIKAQFCYFPHKRAYAQDQDTIIWTKRPLAAHMEMNAVYDVMYLLELQRLTREAMNRPFLQMTELLMKDLRDADELENAMKVGNLHKLPENSLKILPNWNPHPEKTNKLGLLEPPFVHQTLCQIDPMVNFSRDVIHQKKAPGEYSSHQK